MRRALTPVAAGFGLFGMFWGVWAVSTADIEAALGLGPGGFGALLAGGLVVSAALNAVTATFVERHGTSATFLTTLVVWSVALLGLGIAHRPVLVGVALVVTFATGGALDVTLNIAAAAALADRPGALVRFHGVFTAGAVVGAAVAALLGHAHHSWQSAPLGVAALGVVLALASRTVELPAGGAGEEHGMLHAFRTIRTEHLVPLALVFAGSAMVEGGIETWGILFLRRQLALGVLVGTSAYLVGQTIAVLSRWFLGPAVGRRGARRGASLGAGLAATGLLLLAFGPKPVAMFGLAMAAGSVALCWPLMVALAGEGRERPATVVGGVTAVGYLGLVIGPPIVGGLADVWSLRVGLTVLAAVGFAVSFRARRLGRPGCVA